MKKFVVKDIIHNTKSGEVFICYIGTDGYVHDEAKYADGYKSAKVAQKKIDRDKSWYMRFQHGQIINETTFIESNRFIHTMTIVEVEQ